MLSHPFRSGQPFNDGSSSCPKKAPGTGKNGLTDFFSALDTSRPHHQSCPHQSRKGCLEYATIMMEIFIWFTMTR